MYLKEKKYISLQIACGDILDVSILGNNFVINTKEQLIFELLTQKENQDTIKKTLDWQGFYGDIIVNKQLKNEDLVNSDLDKLKKMGIEFKVEKGEQNE